MCQFGRSVLPHHLLILLSFATAACQNKKSQNATEGLTLRFEPAESVVTDTSEMKLSVRASKTSGEAISVEPNLQATPSDVAIVAAGGGVHCLKSGDAVIVATAGGARAEAHVRCRIVDSIRGPDSYELTIPNAPVPALIVALDSHGEEFHDVTPSLSVADPRIARVTQGRLTPLSVGDTKLVARLGPKSSEIPIHVIRKVMNKPLLLRDGAKIDYALNQGRYRAEVKVRAADGSKYGVTVSWVGGDGCSDEAEAQQISSTCEIPDSGALIITNPTGFGLGPAEQGFVSLYQVPSE